MSYGRVPTLGLGARPTARALDQCTAVAVDRRDHGAKRGDEDRLVDADPPLDRAVGTLRLDIGGRHRIAPGAHRVLAVVDDIDFDPESACKPPTNAATGPPPWPMTVTCSPSTRSCAVTFGSRLVARGLARQKPAPALSGRYSAANASHIDARLDHRSGVLGDRLDRPRELDLERGGEGRSRAPPS